MKTGGLPNPTARPRLCSVAAAAPCTASSGQVKHLLTRSPLRPAPCRRSCVSRCRAQLRVVVGGPTPPAELLLEPRQHGDAVLGPGGLQQAADLVGELLVVAAGGAGAVLEALD